MDRIDIDLPAGAETERRRGAGAPLEPGAPRRPLATLDVPLERDVFLRTLLRELAGTLQDVVGLEEASGFVSVVGQNMGRQMDRDYRAALGVRQLTREQVADVLVDLKARIQGDFYVVEQDAEKIVLGNRACPFADKVVGRPALCMMTSNVFGAIAAENLGYAKVELGETIALGAPGCRVIVHLRPTAAAEAAPGREYFGDGTGGTDLR
jgi:predicted ArsR family transcriptional regulator